MILWDVVKFHIRVMKMLKYITIQYQSETTDEYGIALCDGGNVLDYIPRLSDSRAAIAKLTELLNEEQVEPCQFEDIIEDYLTDFSL